MLSNGSLIVDCGEKRCSGTSSRLFSLFLLVLRFDSKNCFLLHQSFHVLFFNIRIGSLSFPPVFSFSFKFKIRGLLDMDTECVCLIWKQILFVNVAVKSQSLMLLSLIMIQLLFICFLSLLIWSFGISFYLLFCGELACARVTWIVLLIEGVVGWTLFPESVADIIE